jgi:phosphoribosyl-dephospho-CoA transferase
MNGAVGDGIMDSSRHAASGEPAFFPHDLLWVADWQALHADAPLPPWASLDWLARAPVVVRREQVDDRKIVPVGLRGWERSQRLGAYLDRSAVLRLIRPEMLVQDVAWRRQPQFERFPAIVALSRLAPSLNASGLCWGPSGGVGYALASGLPVLHADSDLDLLVRSETPLTPDQTRLLRATLSGHGCRIDMQVDTGHGGFTFAEWIRESGRVLLKTGMGPFLTGNPWNRTGWLNKIGKDGR